MKSGGGYLPSVSAGIDGHNTKLYLKTWTRLSFRRVIILPVGDTLYTSKVRHPAR
jgi:hypothetical protein